MKSFEDVVLECFENKDLVREFDRLYGASIGGRPSPIEEMVDRATGKRDDDYRKFIEFVRDCVWDRLPDEAFVQVGVP